MTDLTDKWKKGELPCGWYWCNCYDEEIKLLYYNGDCFELDDPETKNYYFFLLKDIEEITILAPFPSYEEWQKILHYAGKYEFEYTSCAMDYENLKEENTKLKELLKLAKASVDYHCALCREYTDGQILLSKINQALGEDK